MDILDVVMRIVGPVDPVGDFEEDGKRLSNLQDLLDLTNSLLVIIDSIASDQGKEGTVRLASNKCSEFLDKAGITE